MLINGCALINYIKKNEIHVFSTQSKTSTNIKINNIEINRISQFNFVGIILSADLKWKKHIDHISMKISKVIGIM